MRRLGRLACGLGLATAVVAAVPAMASVAASSHQHHAPAAAHARIASRHITRGAADNCLNEQPGGGEGLFCDFSETSGNDLCFVADSGISNWGVYGCRNIDESFANETGGLMRLYYSPDHHGAWACVNNGWYSNDMNKDIYTFDNGSGDAGYGQEIWDNVASNTTASGSCSNPLPEDG
jgi:hypothetical protein